MCIYVNSIKLGLHKNQSMDNVYFLFLQGKVKVLGQQLHYSKFLSLNCCKLL